MLWNIRLKIACNIVVWFSKKEEKTKMKKATIFYWMPLGTIVSIKLLGGNKKTAKSIIPQKEDIYWEWESGFNKKKNFFNCFYCWAVRKALFLTSAETRKLPNNRSSASFYLACSATFRRNWGTIEHGVPQNTGFLDFFFLNYSNYDDHFVSGQEPL